jgi:DNA uptake protein ComE-like DNA-binding protein
MHGRLITGVTEAAGDTRESLSYLLACFTALVLAMALSSGVLHQSDKASGLRLQARINPNDAPVASLMRLPQIGIARAEQIAAYRQAHEGEGRVFTCPDDLQNVKGIGPAIAAGFSEYLRFE